MSKRFIEQPMLNKGIKLSKFLVAGLPALLLAIPLNYFLVTSLKWDESIAYALVLVGQVTMNFFMCRRFVFEQTSDKPVLMQFCYFFSGILLFRVADWGLYSFLVKFCGLYFVAIQLLNVVLFAYFKFKFSERVIEPR